MVVFLDYFKAGLSSLTIIIRTPGWHSISTLSHDLVHSCICRLQKAVATSSCYFNALNIKFISLRA